VKVDRGDFCTIGDCSVGSGRTGDLPHSTQLRTLLFLLDVETAELFDGPHFNWQPGPFGPVSPAVSTLLHELGDQGLVVVRRLGRRNRMFRTSAGGYAAGVDEMAKWAETSSSYLLKMLVWSKSTDTLTLIEDEVSIRYPHMELWGDLIRLHHEFSYRNLRLLGGKSEGLVPC
jgi:hypothetical protein